MAIPISEKLSKYQKLEKAFGVVSGKWTGDIELAGEPGSREVYHSLARAVLLRAFRVSGALSLNWRLEQKSLEEGTERDDVGVYSGTRVIAAHLYMATMTAGVHGIGSLDELESLLRHPDTFVDLAELTDVTSQIAGRTEGRFGLKHSGNYWGEDDVAYINEGGYEIKDGAIVMPKLRLEKARHILHALEQDEPTEAHCHAHSAGVLELIYGHFITISLKDARLAVASLQRGIVVATPS